MSKKEWGNITWKFFHTLAEKIDENHFSDIKDKLINIILNTCSNLPCPDCSEHATNILKRSYIKNINNKNHFIEFLRQFHNIVNIKLEKKEVKKEEIVEMYKNENISKIFNQFIYYYKNIRTSERMMSNNFHRNLYLKNLVNDINQIRYAINS